MAKQMKEVYLDEHKKEAYLNKLSSNIDQDEIRITRLDDLETAQEAIEIAQDVVMHPREKYRINGATYTIDEVMERLSKLTTDHIKCVAFKLNHYKGIVQNRYGYVLSTLFNITRQTQKQAKELLEYLIEEDKEKDEDEDD